MTGRSCRRQEDGSRSSESIPRTTDWHGSLVSSSAPQRPKYWSDCCQNRPSIAWKVPRSERNWSARSKGAVTNELEGGGFPLNRTTEDREELAIDVRLLDTMLRASSDREVGIGALAIGFRVVPVQRCPGVRSCTPRRMQEQRVQQEVDEELAAKGLWNHNYASAVLRSGRAARTVDSCLVMEESEARRRFPNLARVLSDGTVNHESTAAHVTVQVRGPVASDLKKKHAAHSVSRTTHVRPHGGRQKRRTGRFQSTRPTGTCWDVNTVGYFGVCCQVAPSIGRLTQCFTGRYATSWLMPLADDVHLEE